MCSCLQGVADSSLDQSHLLLLGEEQASLIDRLKIPQSDPDFDPVPSQLLRKYVGYARKYVHPHLSSEAAAELQVQSMQPSKRANCIDMPFFFFFFFFYKDSIIIRGIWVVVTSANIACCDKPICYLNGYCNDFFYCKYQ